jgi:hypothetical protein
VGVLAAGLATVLALFIRSRLYPGKQAYLVDPRVTDDRFAVMMDMTDAGFDFTGARGICLRHGAESVEEVLTPDQRRKPRKPEIDSLEVWR